MNTQALVSQFLEAENRRDWITVANHLADDITYHVIGSVGEIVRGRQAYLAKMRATYTELPDWQFTIRNIKGGGDVVMVEFDGHGHFTGEYKGEVYTNVALRLLAVCVFKLETGLIKEIREYWDQAGFESALLGKVPARLRV